MNWTNVAFAATLSGFHVIITILAIYRAHRALGLARRDGRADTMTLVRLASVRLVAVVVVLTGAVLAACTPMLIFGRWLTAFLPTSTEAMGWILFGAWLVWILATILLDNLALRWWKRRPR